MAALHQSQTSDEFDLCDLNQQGNKNACNFYGFTKIRFLKLFSTITILMTE